MSRRVTPLLAGLLVSVLVLAVTAGFVAQQDAARNERRSAEFSRVAAIVSQRLNDEVAFAANEFTVVRDFVESVDSFNEAELRGLLARRSGRVAPAEGTSSGLLLLESVDDVQELEDRERRKGRPDFTVTQLLPGTSGGERLVMTYTELDVDMAGRSVIGFDVTSLPETFGFNGLVDLESDDRVAVRLFTADQMQIAFQLLGERSDSSEFEPAILFVVAEWSSPDGSSSGFLFRLDSINALIDAVAGDVPAGFMLRADLAGSERSIARIDNRSNGAEQFAQSLSIEGFDAASTSTFADLNVTLAAGDDFRVLNEPDLHRTWLFGALAAAVLAGLVGLRVRQERRLAETGVELEIAHLMASTDHLTGLLNRQGLLQVVQSGDHHRGTLMFIDLDDFKKVNDQSGHGDGDRVLRAVARALTELVRDDDHVCRLGGDEFLVYLVSDVTEDRVDTLAGAIESAIEAIDDRISASVGVARQHGGDPIPIDELMKRADEDMYRVKRDKKAVAR